MSTLDSRAVLRTLVTSPVYDLGLSIFYWSQARYRRWVFAFAFQEFLKLKDYEHVDYRLLQRLTYGWGNESFSANTEYMAAYLSYACRASGPILECGSGLSTLLLGVVAAKHNNQVWTLEHEPEWGHRVGYLLRHWKINSVHLLVSPLQRYGDYDWYRLHESIHQTYALVICDGPPMFTRGGRYGLLPLMGKHLNANSIILLDDYGRPEEQAIVKRWREEAELRVEACGTNQTYAVISTTAQNASMQLS